MINELKMETLTRVVNDIRSPNTFLTRFLYGTERTLETETIRIDTRSRGRVIAPFVRVNGEAIAVPGRQASGYSVTAPNIRIKRPFTPSELLFNRQPGGVFFNPAAGSVGAAVRRHIAEDLEDMVSYIDNAKEYLVSRTLQGSVAYEVADQEVFQIDYPRSSDNNITLTHFWDEIYPDAPTILADIRSAQRVVNEAGLPALTDAILGQEASEALSLLVEKGLIPSIKTDSGVRAGSMTLVENFRDDGVLFLGELGGIRFWEYSRSAEFVDGTQVSMIRPKYAEFVSRSTATDRVMYYGAIPDMKALRGQRYVGRNFAKSWEENDPSGYVGLIHSRPLPVPRQPNASVSMKVVSG